MAKRKNKNNDYDVKLGQEIHFFDPTLSYELTGYRPIDDKNGLDFNPDDFRQAAIHKEKTGQYTDYPPKTIPFREFWKEEMRRCEEGYQVGNYRITGDNYFYINYYQLPLTNETNSKGKAIRKVGISRFWAEHYKYFHYLEMCEMLKRDSCVLKARGVKSCPLS